MCSRPAFARDETRRCPAGPPRSSRRCAGVRNDVRQPAQLGDELVGPCPSARPGTRRWQPPAMCPDSTIAGAAAAWSTTKPRDRFQETANRGPHRGDADSAAPKKAVVCRPGRSTCRRDGPPPTRAARSGWRQRRALCRAEPELSGDVVEVHGHAQFSPRALPTAGCRCCRSRRCRACARAPRGCRPRGPLSHLARVHLGVLLRQPPRHGDDPRPARASTTLRVLENGAVEHRDAAPRSALRPTSTWLNGTDALKAPIRHQHPGAAVQDALGDLRPPT